MESTNRQATVASLIIVGVFLVFMCLTVVLLFMPGLLSFILGYTLAILVAFFFGMLMVLALILVVFKVADKIHFYAVMRAIRKLEFERHRRQTVGGSRTLRTPWWSKQELSQSSIQHRSHDPDDYGC
jgi:hypothetical protein